MGGGGLREESERTEWSNVSWSLALSWISMVTDLRFETFEEREFRRALFCLVGK